MKRRDFLKLFCYSSVAALAYSAGLPVFSRGRWVYEFFGLQLHVPETWSIYTTEVIPGLQGKQEYANDSTAISDDGGVLVPLLAFSKYMEPIDKMNPSIVLFADQIPSDWDAGMEEIAAELESAYSKRVLKYSLVSPTAKFMNRETAIARTLVTYEHRESTGFNEHVLRESLLFRNESHIFLVFLTQSYAGPERADFEFEVFRNNLAFMGELGLGERGQA